MTNSVSSREVFNEKIKIFSSIKNTSHFLYNKEIEKNLKVRTKAGHCVQSKGERIIADRLFECGIDYVYDSLLEVNDSWIRPDFLLPKLDNFIIEFKGMDEPEYHENQRFSGCQKSSIFVHGRKASLSTKICRRRIKK